MYALPQAGILANKLLRHHLKPFNFYKVDHTPGLWRHKTLPVFFTLVVNNFGIQYVDKRHALHLVEALQKLYDLGINWTGLLYCGISLAWNYDKQYVDTSMPKYVPTQSMKFNHK